MSDNEKKVSYDFSNDFMNLPPRMRVKVITTAMELQEIQEKNEKFLDYEGELGLEEERGE